MWQQLFKTEKITTYMWDDGKDPGEEGRIEGGERVAAVSAKESREGRIMGTERRGSGGLAGIPH